MGESADDIIARARKRKETSLTQAPQSPPPREFSSATAIAEKERYRAMMKSPSPAPPQPPPSQTQGSQRGLSSPTTAPAAPNAGHKPQDFPQAPQAPGPNGPLSKSPALQRSQSCLGGSTTEKGRAEWDRIKERERLQGVNVGDKSRKLPPSDDGPQQAPPYCPLWGHNPPKKTFTSPRSFIPQAKGQSQTQQPGRAKSPFQKTRENGKPHGVAEFSGSSGFTSSQGNAVNVSQVVEESDTSASELEPSPHLSHHTHPHTHTHGASPHSQRASPPPTTPYRHTHTHPSQPPFQPQQQPHDHQHQHQTQQQQSGNYSTTSPSSIESGGHHGGYPDPSRARSSPPGQTRNGPHNGSHPPDEHPSRDYPHTPHQGQTATHHHQQQQGLPRAPYMPPSEDDSPIADEVHRHEGQKYEPSSYVHAPQADVPIRRQKRPKSKARSPMRVASPSNASDRSSSSTAQAGAPPTAPPNQPRTRRAAAEQRANQGSLEEEVASLRHELQTLAQEKGQGGQAPAHQSHPMPGTPGLTTVVTLLREDNTPILSNLLFTGPVKYCGVIEEAMSEGLPPPLEGHRYTLHCDGCRGRRVASEGFLPGGSIVLGLLHCRRPSPLAPVTPLP